MAYTNTWAQLAITGAAAPDTIDEKFTQVALAIQERMDDVVVDWTADPVVPKAQLKIGVQLMIPAYSLMPTQDEDDISSADGYVQSDDSGTNDMRLGLPVRDNWSITNVTCLFDLNTASAGVTIDLMKTTYDAAATTSSLGSVTVNAGGIGLKGVFTGTEATDGVAYYFLKIVGTGSGRYRVYAVRIIYSEI